MNLLFVPRVKNKELQSLAEESIRICSTVDKLKPSLKQVIVKFEEFVQGMRKEGVTAEEKKLMDNERDVLIRGLVKQIAAEEYYPHTHPEALEVVKSLSRINHKYGVKITRFGYNEQSAATDNLVSDLKGLKLEVIPESPIPRWIPLIENANNSFKAAMNSYLSESAEQSDLSSATQVAPELCDALNGLYSMVYALNTINPGSKITQVNKELEVLIDSF